MPEAECPYCDTNFKIPNDAPNAAYVAALEAVVSAVRTPGLSYNLGNALRALDHLKAEQGAQR